MKRPYRPTLGGSRVVAALVVLLVFGAISGLAAPLTSDSAAPASSTADLAALRFVKYNQPSAYHADFWEQLDLLMLQDDFRLLRKDGFNGIALPLPFGSFVARASPEGFVLRPENLEKLDLVLQAAARHGLVTVLWFNDHRFPVGVSGTRVEAFTDSAGLEHPPFSGYYGDGLGVGFSGDHRWQAFLGFSSAVAEVAARHTVVWDPLDWQYALIHTFQMGEPEVLRAWRAHLHALDPELAVWATRWREPLSSWEDVLLPVSASQLASIQEHAAGRTSIRTDLEARQAWELYSEQPETAAESRKWEDYWSWRDVVIDLMWVDVVTAIRAYSSAPLGQRVDVEVRFGMAGREEGDWRPIDGVDFLMYPVSLPVGDRDALDAKVEAVAIASGKPVVLWEAIVTRREARQAAWAEASKLASELDVGIGLWAWRDNYFNYYTDDDNGLRTVSGELKTDRQAIWLLDYLAEATLEPDGRGFDTPTGQAAFTGERRCGTRLVPVLYTVAPSAITFGVDAVEADTILRFGVLHPWTLGDGVSATVSIDGQVALELSIDPLAEGAPPCEWQGHALPLPQGRVTISLQTRIRDDSTADWLAWSDLTLERIDP